jgi:hypothetical protein
MAPPAHSPGLSLPAPMIFQGAAAAMSLRLDDAAFPADGERRRCRQKSTPALPAVCRVRRFSRWRHPSVGPLLQVRASPALLVLTPGPCSA